MSDFVPPSPPGRALQALVVAALAALLVLGSAAASAALFDQLPSYLDVLLVIFVFPFVLFFGILMFDAKVLTPLWPNWLRRSDGREADLPGLIAGALLAASIAAIYPGMFPGRIYANLTLRGASFDVVPETAPLNAAFYRFRDATLRADLGGSASRKVVVRENGISRTVTRWTHVAPIVGRGWTPPAPVVAWAVSDDDGAPWWDGAPNLIEGLRLSDERGDSLRAVRRVAQEKNLRLADEPLLIEVGDGYDEHLRRSRRRTWAVLAPLCLLVLVGVGGSTWALLGPGRAT